jgi:hypothetical protein
MTVSFASSPPEEADLFNPAFLSLLIAVATRDYEVTADTLMPFELAFVIPPIALDADARAQLPGNVNALLSPWLIAHPVLQVAIAQRAKALVPFVREALRYGLRARAIEFSDAGLHSRVSQRSRASLRTQDARDCAIAAAFVGRWLARTGDTPTIFALLGVRP